MQAQRLVGSDGYLELNLDGLTFVRSKAGASARGTERLLNVEWVQVVAARLTQSTKGKPVVRIDVAGAPEVFTHKRDRYALKVKRRVAADAREFVDRVNDEAAVRRTWRDAAGPTGQ